MTLTKITKEHPQTIDGVKAKIADGTRTAVATAEEAYSRISEVDPAIHAYLALSRERALRQAQKIDAMAATGEALPALAGVPIGIKDVLNMQGAPAIGWLEDPGWLQSPLRRHGRGEIGGCRCRAAGQAEL